MTERDAGATFTLERGRSISLRLSNGPLWGPPAVDGPAVVLERQSYESDPGFTEYLVRAVAAGEAAVRVGGEPGCEARDACPDEVVLTFVVE